MDKRVWAVRNGIKYSCAYEYLDSNNIRIRDSPEKIFIILTSIIELPVACIIRNQGAATFFVDHNSRLKPNINLE